jgi:cobalt-zinc-cadmium efflux system outer membrane protein
MTVFELCRIGLMPGAHRVAVFTLSLLCVTLIVRQAQAQQPSQPVTHQSGNLPNLISMDDAVRIALAYNQGLRAQRLNVDQSKAGEITAGLKPNPTFSSLIDTIPIFSPQNIRISTQIYSEALSYTVERGGKREKRVAVAKDNTDVSEKTVDDNERQLRFQVVQAYINAVLAKSVLQFSKEDLANYSQEVDLNHARLVAGDLAEGDYLKLSLQKLQFEQDVTSAELGLIQAMATLRQLLGYQSVADNFDVSGTLAHNKQSVTLDDLNQKAIENRPDLQAARSGITLANDTVALAFGNRVKDWTWATDYTNQNFGINGVGISLSFDLPITIEIRVRSHAARRLFSRRGKPNPPRKWE